jgi:GntR family transcriptional regulator
LGIIESGAALDRLGPTPIFQQIKAILERAIASGELAAHQRIPSERELSAALGVSRMTLRQALIEMTSDGTLYTRSGKGTYVADRKIEQPLQRLSSFTQDIEARGMRPASKVLSQELLSAPLELAGVLQVPPGSELVRIRRLRLADDQPLGIETSHLPHVLCPGLLRCDLSSTSLYEILRTQYGVGLGSAKQTIEASQPAAEERQLLRLPDGVPVLRIHRLTSGVDGRLVEFVRAVYRGDRYQLHVELQ